MRFGGGDVGGAGAGRDRYGKPHPNASAFATGAIYLNFCVVPLSHSVNHRQTKTRASLAFGRKEGFQAAAARLLIHSYTGVGHLDINVLLPRLAAGFGPKRQRASLWHGVHGIKDEINKGFPNFALDARDRRQVWR